MILNPDQKINELNDVIKDQEVLNIITMLN